MNQPAKVVTWSAGMIRPGLGIVLRRYLFFTGITNLVWESAHLPLYTLWTEGNFGDLVFAVVHCTGGDLLIAFLSLALAVILVGYAHWPIQRFAPVMALTVAFGLAYTVFSEWLNVVVQQSWAYSELMPVIPIIDAGLSPVAQWLVIPLVGLTWAQSNTQLRSHS